MKRIQYENLMLLSKIALIDPVVTIKDNLCEYEKKNQMKERL
jgi:hypothetical protein